MGWLNDLCLTYDLSGEVIGKNMDGITLLPIAHSTQNAQIEVILSEKGEFLSARRLEKPEAETVIPVTEDSASRSSGIAPHPLCDKLVYIAGDYVDYVKDKKDRDYQKYFDAYIEQLKQWNDSPYANKKVRAIYRYLSKAGLIRDLVEHEILMTEENGLLDPKQKIMQTDQRDSFVRFRVESPGVVEETAVWKDTDTYRSFQEYYLNSFSDKTLCYASGKECYCSDKHPAKLRTSADKAKLISANDTSGFTFRGRFDGREEANAISYEVSQKAHNALKWLIQRQGMHINEMVLVAWGTGCVEIPEPGASTQKLWNCLMSEEEVDENTLERIQKAESSEMVVDTQEYFAEQIKKAVFGSLEKLDDEENVTILTLEAATIGRLSITYYKQLNGSKYKENLFFWHHTCCYYDSYKRAAGAPGIYEIVDSAYGVEQNGMLKTRDKVKQAAVSRLLPCIVDRKNVPFDLVELLAARASNPAAYERSNRRKVRNTAGAVIRKYYNQKKEKEEYTMALQEERPDRDYLFGRLLAVAYAAEYRVLRMSGELRDTNAERFMNAFRSHPYSTWGVIDKKLQPYLKKLRSVSVGGTSQKKDLSLYYATEIQTILNQFRIGAGGKSEFENNEPLSPLFILGYNAELDKIFKGSGKQDNDNTEEKENANE